MRAGTGAYACTFTYDGPGNRLTQMQADGTLTTYTYNPASELLTSQVGEAVTTFSYDPVGNTVGEQSAAGEIDFTWDGENRLVEVDDGETVETSAYDATGLRRQKTAGGETTNFVWDRVNLLAELDDTLARLAQYTDYPGVWGGLSSQRRNSTSSYYAFDLSANTRALFNGGGITDRYLYEAFGVEQIVTGSTVNPLRFGGQVGYFRDLAERLYVRARHYQPGVGRWMSRDPAGELPGSPCIFSGNSPVRRVDPSGEQWQLVLLLLALIALGGYCIWRVLSCARYGARQEEKWKARVKELWPEAPDKSDGANAFRHCYGTCISITGEPWAGCWELGMERHEKGTPHNADYYADVHNNGVGLALGRALKSDPAECERHCLEKLRNGELDCRGRPCEQDDMPKVAAEEQ